jgi:hypothetical protein
MTEKLLFWLQVIMAWVYTAPQVIFIVSGKTAGLTLAVYVVFLAYMALGLTLSISSYKIKREKARKHLIIIFLQWLILVGAILAVGLNKIIWRPGDTVICVAILILSVFTIAHFRGFKDPIGRGLLAVWCKAIPQLWLAYTMLNAKSSAGVPIITLLAGHITSIPRLIEIFISGSKHGWDRPTKGLLLGESANILTWVAVTIVWIFTAS